MNTSNALPASSLSAKLARSAYPEYRGRKIRTAVRASYTMADYWDGGSRYYVRAVELATGRIVDPSTFAQNPMNRAAHATFQIPAGIALIEHAISCGTDCGLTVIVGAAPALEGSIAQRVIA